MPSWMPVEGTLRSLCVMFLRDPGSFRPAHSARDDTRASAGAGAGALWLLARPACMAHRCVCGASEEWCTGRQRTLPQLQNQTSIEPAASLGQ